MVFFILLFFVLSSGSVLAAAYGGRRYEEVLPLTIFAIMAVFYLLGIFGALQSGLYVVLALAAGAYLLAGYLLLRKKNLASFLKNLFTPGFIFFVIFFLMAYVCSRGMVPNTSDEFSHWADTVKVMYTMGDFSANPAAHAMFSSYPPAMATFQYFMQLFRNLLGSGGFSEWLLYFSYQTACGALLAACFRGLRWKPAFGVFASIAAAILLPLLGFSTFYSSIYVDAYLGLLAGFCFAYPFVIRKKRDLLQLITLCAALAMLILTKQAGMMFAIMAAAAYILGMWLDYWKSRRENGASSAPIKKYIVYSLAVIGAILLAKISWTIFLHIKNAAEQFDGEVSIAGIFSVLFGSDPADAYRRQTIINYIMALFAPKFQMGNGSEGISFFALSSLLLVGFLFLSHQEDKRNPQGRLQRRCLDICSIATYLIYTAGLCIMYMFKFPTAEAVRLASFDRYIRIAFLALLFLQFARLVQLIRQGEVGNRALGVILALLIFFAPLKSFGEYLSRENVRAAKEKQAPFIEYAQKALETIPGEGNRVFFVSQGTNGDDYYTMRYRMRPQYVANLRLWSLDENLGMDAQALQQELKEKEYEYFALYAIDDYFMDHYASLFEDPAEMAAGRLYRVTQEGTLVYVPME